MQLSQNIATGYHWVISGNISKWGLVSYLELEYNLLDSTAWVHTYTHSFHIAKHHLNNIHEVQEYSYG